MNELALSTNQSETRQLLLGARDSLSARSCLLSDFLSMDSLKLENQVNPITLSVECRH